MHINWAKAISTITYSVCVSSFFSFLSLCVVESLVVAGFYRRFHFIYWHFLALKWMRAAFKWCVSDLWIDQLQAKSGMSVWAYICRIEFYFAFFFPSARFIWFCCCWCFSLLSFGHLMCRNNVFSENKSTSVCCCDCRHMAFFFRSPVEKPNHNSHIFIIECDWLRRANVKPRENFRIKLFLLCVAVVLEPAS